MVRIMDSPPHLAALPLRGSAAVRLGQVTRRELQRNYRRVLPDVYLPLEVPLDATQRAMAAWVWARGRACLSGRSAAAIWGVSGISPDAPAALSSPENLRPPLDVELYRTSLRNDERTEWLGIGLTTPAHTAYEIARRLPFGESLPIIEQLYRRHEVTPDAVLSLAHRRPGSHHAGRIWNVISSSRTGVATPFQSRTRAAIMTARLPEPDVMIDVYGAPRGCNARAHIGWRDYRVAVQCIENNIAAELTSLNQLVQHGWLAFAVEDDHTLGGPSDRMLSTRISHALQHRGWRPS